MRLHRLIAILLLMESRGLIKAQEMAEALETSKRTINRDIEILCEAGVPIISTAGPLGGYSLMDGYSITLNNLHCDDVINLYLSGIGVYPHKYSETRINLKRTLLKLESSLPSEYTSDIKIAKERFYFDPDNWQDNRPVLHHLDILRKSVWHCKKLYITYNNASLSNNETKTRVVNPYGLVVKNTDWYLVAFCELRQDMRVFKCERIIDAILLKEQFNIPQDFCLETYWYKWVENFKSVCLQAPYYPVQLKLISQDLDALKNIEIVEQIINDNSSNTIIVNLYTYSNACALAIEFRDSFEVISPFELREFIIDNSRKILSLYTSS